MKNIIAFLYLLIKLKSNEDQSQAITAESMLGLLAIPATLYLYRSSDIINITRCV